MQTLKRIGRKAVRTFRQFWRKIHEPPRMFRDRYNTLDNSSVEIFINEKTDKIQAHSLHVSLVAAVKDEADSLDRWFTRILQQSRLPEEIVIVDGGSTDGTWEKIMQYQASLDLPIRVFRSPDGNIAVSRNLAIQNARFELIAVTDFGCFPKTDWLQKLIAPFETDEAIQVSAGRYEPVGKNGPLPGNQKNLWSWSFIDKIDAQSYLPPGGSVAFRKGVWQSVGGYPEWLTRTGEDTFFDLELKYFGGKWAFSPDAVVEWIAPETFTAYVRKMYDWAIGDGESGVHARYFWYYVRHLAKWSSLAAVFLALLILTICLPLRPVWLWLLLILAAGTAGAQIPAHRAHLSFFLVFQNACGEFSQVLGFVIGYRNRKTVDSRRQSALRGTFILCAGVPLDDTGGGSRGAQLARELLRQKFSVIYLNRFPKYESRELGLDFSHPDLFRFSSSGFNWDSFFADNELLIQGESLCVIVEFPDAEYLPIIQSTKSAGGKILYDLIDDWQTSLGADWYSPDVEQAIVHSANLFTATTSRLQTWLSKTSKHLVMLMPNAVDRHLFDPTRSYPRPADLPEKRKIFLYSGALWGEWFDWELLDRLAGNFPEDFFCILGDYRGQFGKHRDNISFPGLKPQQELPAYIRHADCAILPWKISKITEHTSPLKVYEYLAMGCPVIAPDIEPLHGIHGVFPAKNETDFLELCIRVDRSCIDGEIIRQFITENDWQTRVKKVIQLFDQSSQDG